MKGGFHLHRKIMLGSWRRLRRCALLMLPLLGGLAYSQPTDLEDQSCEMCGLLMLHLEDVLQRHTSSAQVSGRKKSVIFSRVAKASKREDEATVPADAVAVMQTFFSETAVSAVRRIRLCSANGDDDSKLRNPSGIEFEREGCTARLQERCEYICETYAESMMAAAYHNKTASSCAAFLLPAGSCTPERATLLLGHSYKPGAPRFLQLEAGLKDIWRKMPGNPPFYHNAARHETQDDPPKGWDPNGPSAQVLRHDKEEL